MLVRKIQTLLAIVLLSATTSAFAQSACTLTCPSDISTNTPPGGDAAIVDYAFPIASAECTAAPVQTAGLPPGSSFPVGTTMNCFSAPGPSGNGTCCFSVTVAATAALPPATPIPAGRTPTWWMLAGLTVLAAALALFRWPR